MEHEIASISGYFSLCFSQLTFFIRLLAEKQLFSTFMNYTMKNNATLFTTPVTFTRLRISAILLFSFRLMISMTRCIAI